MFSSKSGIFCHGLIKRQILVITLGFLCFAFSSQAGYYVSTQGSDANTGTSASPFLNIASAVSIIQPGDTIYVLPGSYKYSAMTTLAVSGTSDKKICLFAADMKNRPVFDYSDITPNDTFRAFLLTGDYWHVKGVEVYCAPDNGIKIEGNHNVVEYCVFHDCYDSGLQIGLVKDSDTSDGSRAGYNLILNCDSYNNCDSHKSGGNADGFANKLCTGPGNHFKGCRSWNNSDDGWDLYQNNNGTLLEECRTWHNGDSSTVRLGKAGNGNGFKMGGNSSFGCVNIAYRCISFDNHFVAGGGKGFDQNDNNRGQIVLNCTSFGNTKNYSFSSGSAEGHTIENCVAFDFYEKNISNKDENTTLKNSWQLEGYTVSGSDFISISEDMAKADRNEDGSLPENSFCRLAAGSGLIDKGMQVSYEWDGQTVSGTYSGTAPDIGAFEYDSSATPVLIGSFAKNISDKTGNCYCSPASGRQLTTVFFRMLKTGKVVVSLCNAQGKQVKKILNQSYPQGENFYICPVMNLPSGIYYFRIRQSARMDIVKFVRN